MGASIHTNIEIEAPPALVREKFLNFPAIPKYSPQGFFTYINSPYKNPNIPISVGERIKLKTNGMTFDSEVTANSPEMFQWSGFKMGLKGTHTFRFTKGPRDGTTVLIHEDQYEGPAAFLMGNNFFGRSTRAQTEAGFLKWNSDFKKFCEEKQLVSLR